MMTVTCTEGEKEPPKMFEEEKKETTEVVEDTIRAEGKTRVGAKPEREKFLTVLAEAPAFEEERETSAETVEEEKEETTVRSKVFVLSFIGIAVSLVIAVIVYLFVAIKSTHGPIALPKEEFKLSPFWNFRKNPFICAKSGIRIHEKKWCDQLFDGIDIEATGSSKPLNSQNRELTNYLSGHYNHYSMLRDKKVYQQDKNFLWWLDKLSLRTCTEAITNQIPIKCTPMKKHWTKWDDTTKTELQQYLDNYFADDETETKTKNLFMKPGHTGCVKGIMTLMYQNNPDHKCAFGEGKCIVYDPLKNNSFEQVEERIDEDFFMNPAIKYDEKFKNDTPTPSIIIEEEMNPLLEIKCTFIFGIMKQCFTWGYDKHFHGKFNRKLECILNDHDNETTEEGCKNLLAEMNWVKIIPRLEELAFKLHFDRVRIDIFRKNYDEFYINEYDPRSYSSHTNNKYLFDELKIAWKNAKYLPTDHKNAFNDFNGKCEDMQKRLNNYKGNFF